MNILVVDDEEIIVRGIVKRLEKIADIPMRVVGASSGEEALQLMENFLPDLLITDIQMTPMDGLELISIVRERNLCSRFIILTAFEKFEYARQALKYQALDYLLKPVDWDALEAHIRRLAMKSDKQRKIDGALAEYAPLFAELDRTEVSGTLKKLTKYIRANCTHEISLTHLSVYSGLSENSICNLFKKELGITFLDYVYELRLKKSIELLIGDDSLPVREISAQVGYRSERQFFRIFRSKLELTPQQFRERYDS